MQHTVSTRSTPAAVNCSMCGQQLIAACSEAKSMEYSIERYNDCKPDNSMQPSRAHALFVLFSNAAATSALGAK